MKHFGALRAASCVLVVFCLGHTAGGMLAQKSLGPASDAVFAAMKSVHFVFNGARCTWYGFWFGFGLVTSVFLLFSAVAAWSLSNVSPAHWPAVSPIAWALFAAHVGNAVLTWMYFFAGAGVLATLIAALLGIASFRRHRTAVLAAHAS